MNTQESQQLLLEEKYVILVSFNGKFRNNVVFVIVLLISKQCSQKNFAQNDIGEEKIGKREIWMNPKKIINKRFYNPLSIISKIVPAMILLPSKLGCTPS
jgi:hypothetical protein